MQCFEHQSESAVGICKHCNKGVCSKCAVDLSHGIACRDSCETEVENIDALINNSKVAYSNAKSPSQYFLSVFLGLAGSGFLVRELLSSKPLGFGLYMGVAFLVLAAYLGVVTWRYSKKIDAGV